MLPRIKSSKIKKKKKRLKKETEEKNKKKIQAIEYCKRRNQRIGKFPDSIEKNDLLSMFKASLSFLNKRGKKFNNPS